MFHRLLVPFVLAAAAFSSCKPQKASSSRPGSAPLAGAVLNQPSRPGMEEWGEAIYVSPEGSDHAGGGRADPVATIAKALTKLPPDREGAIALLGGTYREAVRIPEGAKDAPALTIAAVPGEAVIFEGGEEVSEWQSYHDEPGLYVIDAPGRQAKFEYETDYFEVWESESRVRYRKVLDAGGVRAWPGSVCPLEGDRLLVRTRDGRSPKAVSLRRNREADGFAIGRSNVTLRGVRFQNYVGGGNARAVTVGKGGDVAIRDCEIVNCVVGVSTSGDRTRVEDCRLLEVGLGVRQGDCIDLTVRNCLIESATGLFAISDLGEHLRDGIRIYHPADGATVEGCVTSGFWTGLYIKTISAREGSRPYYVRNNTFLDGIRSGAGHLQPRSYYTDNIVGSATGDGTAPNGAYLLEMGATLKGNYFYGQGETTSPGNRAGPEPFIDLGRGDLSLKEGVASPQPEGGAEPGAPMRKVAWSPRMAALLAPPETKNPAFRFVREPSAVGSRTGALVTAGFSSPAEGVLRYRKTGGNAWRTIKGRGNTVLPSEGMRASAPFEWKTPDEYAVVFALIDGELEPDAEYEFQVEAAGSDKKRIESATGRVNTGGGPKEIRVSASASGEGAPDGSEQAPYPRLQEALDRALPGDTVVLAKGVYTAPVILTHGGTDDAPLTICGAGMSESILDGGKETANIIRMIDANHVKLNGVQIRWFGNNAILAENSSHGTVEDCWIINTFLPPGGGGISGQGISLRGSPGWTVRRCLFNKVENGLVASDSPGLVFENNTAFFNLYSGAALRNSSKGSRIVGNAFNFTGNQSLRLREDDPEAFASMVCDYNNYGGLLRERAAARPENDFVPAARYGRVSQSKQIIEATLQGKKAVYCRMEDWRTFSGKDEHSIFADPEFVDPTAGDFRLLPGSPNILAEGRLIGAAPVAKNLP